MRLSVRRLREMSVTLLEKHGVPSGQARLQADVLVEAEPVMAAGNDLPDVLFDNLPALEAA